VKTYAIAVSGADGRPTAIQVPGTLVGCDPRFLIHRMVDRDLSVSTTRWTVTHLPSGRAVKQNIGKLTSARSFATTFVEALNLLGCSGAFFHADALSQLSETHSRALGRFISGWDVYGRNALVQHVMPAVVKAWAGSADRGAPKR
jgi:hypothetical protein